MIFLSISRAQRRNAFSFYPFMCRKTTASCPRRVRCITFVDVEKEKVRFHYCGRAHSLLLLLWYRHKFFIIPNDDEFTRCTLFSIFMIYNRVALFLRTSSPSSTTTFSNFFVAFFTFHIFIFIRCLGQHPHIRTQWCRNMHDGATAIAVSFDWIRRHVGDLVGHENIGAEITD